MKKSANKLRKALLIIGIILLALAVLSISFYQVDKHRAERDKRPMFTFINWAQNDGGTNFHFGIGYQIITWKRMAEQNGVHGYLVGKEYHYLFGFKDFQADPPPDIVHFEKDPYFVN